MYFALITTLIKKKKISNDRINGFESMIQLLKLIEYYNIIAFEESNKKKKYERKKKDKREISNSPK